MKTRKVRFLALVLAITCVLSVSVSAADVRASDYIDKYEINAISTGSGNIAIKISVNGTNTMTSLGAEDIIIYEKLNGRWMIAGSFDESDSGMVGANTNTFTNTIYFSGYSNTEYKVCVTIFARNISGSDSRYKEIFVNT